MTGGMSGRPDDATVARLFHDTYERLAPTHGWETQERSRTQWDDLPAENRSLMLAVVSEVRAALAAVGSGGPAPGDPFCTYCGGNGYVAHSSGRADIIDMVCCPQCLGAQVAPTGDEGTGTGFDRCSRCNGYVTGAGLHIQPTDCPAPVVDGGGRDQPASPAREAAALYAKALPFDGIVDLVEAREFARCLSAQGVADLVTRLGAVIVPAGDAEAVREEARGALVVLVGLLDMLAKASIGRAAEGPSVSDQAPDLSELIDGIDPHLIVRGLRCLAGDVGHAESEAEIEEAWALSSRLDVGELIVCSPERIERLVSGVQVDGEAPGADGEAGRG